MTKQQIINILTKFATVPNQSKTKFFIPADKISEIATKIMELNKSSFVPPTLQEVKEFVKSKGYVEECAIKAFDYYEAMEWTDNNSKQVKSWKGKIIAIWLKPEYKLPDTKPKGGMVY